MSTLPGFLLRHRVVVEPYEGDSAYGEVYGAAVTVRCFLDQSTRLVRDKDGRQVTSGATFHCRLTAITDIPPDSRVTLPDGRKTTVILGRRRDGGGLPTPDHWEVSLV